MSGAGLEVKNFLMRETGHIQFSYTHKTHITMHIVAHINTATHNTSMQHICEITIAMFMR